MAKKTSGNTKVATQKATGSKAKQAAPRDSGRVGGVRAASRGYE